MSEYIEREPLFNAIYDMACKSVLIPGCEDYAAGLREAANYVEQAPAADVVVRDVKHEWISVKDKMPPEKHYGLMPNADFICSDTCLVTADINGTGRVVKQDWTVDGVWRCYGRYITHWMPMPCPSEPPKGGTE